MSSGEFLISAQGGQGPPWGPRSPGWGGGGGIGSGRTRYKAGSSHQWPVPQYSEPGEVQGERGRALDPAAEVFLASPKRGP